MLENRSIVFPQSEENSYWTFHIRRNLPEAPAKGKRPLEEEGEFDEFPDGNNSSNNVPNGNRRKSPKHYDSGSEDLELSVQLPDDSNQKHGGDVYRNNHDTNSLIHSLGRDISINCLMSCSRSDYGSIASLNRGFHSLLRSGELYKLRRKVGITEHWVYFSCNVHEWDIFSASPLSYSLDTLLLRCFFAVLHIFFLQICLDRWCFHGSRAVGGGGSLQFNLLDFFSLDVMQVWISSISDVMRSGFLSLISSTLRSCPASRSTS